MDRQLYEIELKTSLGIRKGTISLNITDSQIDGILNVLEHTEPFNGTIDESGNCCISGHIVSLMRVVPFTATGIITKSEIKLQLKGERNIFELTGKPERRKRNK